MLRHLSLQEFEPTGPDVTAGPDARVLACRVPVAEVA